MNNDYFDDIDDDDYLNEPHEEPEDDSFDISDCYDSEGNFDYDRLEDAIMDGEYVPDW